MICGIYSITNTVSGKRYIGQSKNIDRRFSDHRSLLSSGKHSNPHLQNSYNLYGGDAFDFEIVLVCSEDDLTTHEQLMADAYRESGLYNIGQFVDVPWRGRKGNRSEKQREHLKKAIQASKESWKDPERRAQRCAILKASWERDPDRNLKASEIVKASWDRDSDRRRKTSEQSSKNMTLFNASLTPKQRTERAKRAAAFASPENMSKAQKKWWSDPDNHKQGTLRLKERTGSPETRAKMSAAAKRRWSDAEERRLQSERLREYHATRGDA